MESILKIFTMEFNSEEKLKKAISNNYLPVIIIDNITHPELIKYSNSAVHFKNLSPNFELSENYKSGKESSDEFLKKYIIKLSENNFQQIILKLEHLAEICNAVGIIFIGESGLCNYLLTLSDLFNRSRLLKNPISIYEEDL